MANPMRVRRIRRMALIHDLIMEAQLGDPNPTLPNAKPPQDGETVLGELPMGLRQLWMVSQDRESKLKAFAAEHFPAGTLIKKLFLLGESEYLELALPTYAFRRDSDLAQECVWKSVEALYPRETLRKKIALREGWKITVAELESEPSFGFTLVTVGD